jgi:hydrogenase expression/formation protein HypC
MCLGVPSQVVEIREETAVVDVGGTRREVSLALVEDVCVGDWVILHAGFAIEKLSPEEAEKTLALFREIADAIH